MNGADPLARDRQRQERERALASIAHHLNQMLGHLRAAEHYNLTHGLQLELPNERRIIDAVAQAARIYQLDKDKPR